MADVSGPEQVEQLLAADSAQRDLPRYELAHSMWGRLGERFGLVSLRPRLASDVRVRREGDEIELVHLSSGRSISLTEDDVRLVRQFDGVRTIAEMIVGEIGQERRLSIQPLLILVDRVVRAEMLSDFPPNLFRQLDNHLARRAVELAHYLRSQAPTDAIERANEGSISSFEQVPWRPRTPLMAERAQFLRTVELLRPLDSWTIGALAEAAHEEAFPAASNIVSEGQVSDRFYIIRSGDVNVLKKDEEGAHKRVAKLGPSDTFGELGLLDETTRTATVRAGPARPVQCYTFESSAFERIISPHISNFRGRQQLAKRRARLEQVTLFSALASADLDRLAKVVREHRAPEGTVVVRQGDEGDKFYVVMEGTVEVLRDELPIAQLGPGDFFGETALLFTQGRTATVVTIEDCTLWSLDKGSFQRLVREQLLGRRDMMPTVLNRLSPEGS